MNISLFVIFVLAMLVEAIIESITLFIEEFHWKLVASFILGAGGSVLFGINLFDVLGVELAFNGMVATILSAILLGLFLVRYSGSVNSLLDFIKSLKPAE